MTKGKKKR